MGKAYSRLATNNTVDTETEPCEIQFENGSDHAVVASYSELYEEGEVEISTVHPTLPVRVKDEEYKLRGWVMLLVRNK